MTNQYYSNKATLAALVGVHGGWYAGHQHVLRCCDLSAVASPVWRPLSFSTSELLVLCRDLNGKLVAGHVLLQQKLMECLTRI